MGVRLGSKSRIEKIGEFGPEKFGISLGHRVKASNFEVYGFGHCSIGVIGIILIILVVLLLMGRI